MAEEPATALDSPIVEITVFPDCARITRRGTLHLPPGEHVLTLAGLAARLEEDSIRVNAEGPGVRLRDVVLADRSCGPSAPVDDSPLPFTIRITLAVESDTEVHLQVRYIARGVTWEPCYDIHLVEGQVHLAYYAVIAQRSGEDWPVADLVLSTARPLIGAAIPRLAPWYLDGPVAAANGAARETTGTAPATDAADSGPVVSYRADGPVGVPTDGAPHRATITTCVFDAQADLFAVPKVSEEVFRRARVKNTSAHVLLPGRAYLYSDTAFAGLPALKTTPPNGAFDLQFGVDDQVVASRELVTLAGGKSAVVGNLRRTQYACQITLENRGAHPVTVTVADQLPVSRRDDTKIRLQDAVPRPNEQDSLNILEWVVPLAPQETREITFTYTVEQPRTL